MNRILKSIIPIIATALGLTGCTDEAPTTPADKNDTPLYNPDGTLAISGTLHIPSMMRATASRSMGEVPDYENLGVYMLVFEEEEGLRQFAKLSAKGTATDDKHGHEGLVEVLVDFHASLEPTEKKTIIHLIATNQENFNEQISIDLEERIVPTLFTNEGCEAYWQRIELESNIPPGDGEGTETLAADDNKAKAERIREQLTHVPMIRNFCRVSIELGPDVEERFELTGLYVFNTVDRGFVAPYVPTNEPGERFVNYYREVEGSDGKFSYAGKSYFEITDQNYVGNLPGGVKVINKIEEGENVTTKSLKGSDGKVAPVYFYERPARENSTERTYAIIKGKYNGSENESFYKIDIGYTDENFVDKSHVVGVFRYYNLLRNFDYRIKLNSVESEGYASFQEASKGAVFNNFSASVEARNMTSISDGMDMIFVNFTSYVFTQPNDWVFLDAQYRVNINDGKGGTVDNSLIDIIWEATPDIVFDIPVQYIGEIDSIGSLWKRYKVSGKMPTADLLWKTLYIYRGKKDETTNEYGLYRAITFFTHTAWNFKHLDTFPGLWDSMDDMPDWEWTDEKREIGQFKGSPLTVFFELPPGLPQAMFPLEFVIESDRQNIQNAYQGNAIVRSVPASESLFYNKPTVVGQPTTSRIQYVKTVSWEDYFGEWSEELVGTGSSIVRCRFLTITDLTQPGIGGTGESGESETIIRVSNKYFDKRENGVLTYHEDGFKRDTKTSDPSPRFWDFNSGIWESTLSNLSNSHDRLNQDNNSNDELVLIEGANNSMGSGSDDNGRYITTSNSGDKFLRKLKYATTQERTIRIEVVSTDNNGNPQAPMISFSRITGNGVPTAPSAPKSTEEAGNLTKYIYEILVEKAVEEFNLYIGPNSSAGMRFYSINFYPRWDEYKTDEQS